MVKVGFIVEGESAKIILESEPFKNLLSSLNLNHVEKIIDAGSGGNMLPHNREAYVAELKSNGATVIVILTDKEDAPCFTFVRDRIKTKANEFVVIAEKALEAWYLADSQTLSAIFQKTYHYPLPEKTKLKPHDALKVELVNNGKPGPGPSKIKFAKRMLKSGFTIQNAAAHEHCDSAKYFCARLEAIANNKH